jgi:hypothetical protein
LPRSSAGYVIDIGNTGLEWRPWLRTEDPEAKTAVESQPPDIQTVVAPIVGAGLTIAAGSWLVFLGLRTIERIGP